MFFYVSLFIACVVTALLVLYLYNALVDAGKEVYRAFLPSSKDKRGRQRQKGRFDSTVNKTAVPWGWKGNESEIREHGPDAATGFDAIIKNNSNESATVGWPYREEKTELAGRANKVSRKPRAVKTGGRSGGKPWGW
jgi:hypothetical protein